MDLDLMNAYLLGFDDDDSGKESSGQSGCEGRHKKHKRHKKQRKPQKRQRCLGERVDCAKVFTLKSRLRLDRPANSIREVRVDFEDILATAEAGRVRVDAVILKRVVFITVDGMQRTQQERIPFTVRVECPESDPGANVSLNATVGLVEFLLVNDQKLLQKLRVTLCIEITDN